MSWRSVSGSSTLRARWYFWICQCVIGSPRSRPLLKVLSLEPILLQWSKVLKLFMASDTSYKWWALPLMAPPYGDYMPVIHNTSNPKSCLKRKSNIICCHFVQEAIATKECLTTHVPILKNFADLLTKNLSGKKRRDLVWGVLYDIYDYCLWGVVTVPTPNYVLLYPCPNVPFVQVPQHVQAHSNRVGMNLSGLEISTKSSTQVDV